MDAYLDHLLDDLVAVEAHEAWQDVLERARRSRRRYLTAIVLVAALVLAPAAWAITQAFQGKPAPPSVKTDFQNWDKFSAQMAKALSKAVPGVPKAILSKAHGVIQVQTADGPIDLWAAPAKDGGTCYLVGWQSDLNRAHAGGVGGCVAATAKQNNAHSSAHNLDWSGGGDYQHRNLEVVYGYTYRGATTVQVTLANGRSKTLPVVEGFFLGAFRRDAQSLASHRLGQDRVVAVTARNTHGQIVGSWKEPTDLPAQIVAVGPKQITRIHGARLLSPTRLAISTWGATGCPSLPSRLWIQSPHQIGILLRAKKPPSGSCSSKRVLTSVVIAINPKQINVHDTLTIQLSYGAGTPAGRRHHTTVLTAPPL